MQVRRMAGRARSRRVLPAVALVVGSWSALTVVSSGSATYATVGSCRGFRNGPGITNSTITIGNASDISGPVPGIYQASQDAVKAYVAYFNSTSSICGRKLRLVALDSQTSTSGNQAAYQTLCRTSFAAVGSMSDFEAGGTTQARACGLPDIRTASRSDGVATCTPCYSVESSNPRYYENAPFTYFFQHNPALKQHVAVAYTNYGGSAEIANTIHGVLTKLGATNIDMEQIGASDFSYDSYVQAMKSRGDQYVIFLGPIPDTIKLQQSMKVNAFTPTVFINDPGTYSPAYVQAAQQAGVGNLSYVYLDLLPFSYAATNHEELTYLNWLHHVLPHSKPSYYGAFAWSAAALFVHEAAQLGGQLTRPHLVEALYGVHSWTDNGMTAPQNVGLETNTSCWQFLRLESGSWHRVALDQCDGVTR